MSQTLQSVLCITTNKYLVRVLVVLLHARFSVVGPIPFLLACATISRQLGQADNGAEARPSL